MENVKETDLKGNDPIKIENILNHVCLTWGPGLCASSGKCLWGGRCFEEAKKRKEVSGKK